MRGKGFTLVEIMIVLAVIAVLASIAIPGFMRFKLKSKTFEATRNLEDIVALLEAHKEKAGSYPDCGLSPADSTVDGELHPWSASLGFKQIGFNPDDGVRYQYAVVVFNAGRSFRAIATGDLDGDGLMSIYEATSDDPVPKRVENTDDF